ncbi:hypothetical protein [Clostridium felsineum]|uniref:Uncharacterized protein n=1 Tax=Clostridium felsineum TaxID=36839 RepID=A0A1S8LWN6_9CLOT|nr:hypothetical protein [Clostridium felsineum]URZ05921.1 hypothetical protein CLROS_012530 [Clostridium felsineum]URZ10958.1 hypothetical protein CROST_016740 [Clostridium felsineum]
MGMIDENLAKRSHENYSFSSYKRDSATSEYNQLVNEAAEQIEKAKTRVSDEGKARLDKLLERYKANMSNWINKHNSNGANHVSVMIAGPANYNMRRHEKYMQKEAKLWDEYDKIKDIGSQISRIVNADKIISSDDENAITKLKEKLKKAEDEHEKYKEYNAKARKEGKQQLNGYVLQNSNARIRSIKKRIEKLEVAAKDETKEIQVGDIKIIDNVEANRVQIVFDNKPSKEMRDTLKRFAFKWSPRNKAWQRFRSLRALMIAKDVCTSDEEKQND